MQDSRAGPVPSITWNHSSSSRSIATSSIACISVERSHEPHRWSCTQRRDSTRSTRLAASSQRCAASSDPSCHTGPSLKPSAVAWRRQLETADDRVGTCHAGTGTSMLIAAGAASRPMRCECGDQHTLSRSLLLRLEHGVPVWRCLGTAFHEMKRGPSECPGRVSTYLRKSVEALCECGPQRCWRGVIRPAIASSAPYRSMGLRNRRDLAGTPRLVEPWLKRGVEAQNHEPALAGDGLNPVVLVAGRGRGAEEDID